MLVKNAVLLLAALRTLAIVSRDFLLGHDTLVTERVAASREHLGLSLEVIEFLFAIVALNNSLHANFRF